MIDQEKRSAVVRYWLEKREESMASARREFEAGSLSFAMNRLYYTAFLCGIGLIAGAQPGFREAFRGSCCFSSAIHQDGAS